MAVRELTLESLQEIGGGTVAAAFQHHIKRCLIDCEDRPGDKSAREITLTVMVKPDVGQDGQINNVSTEYKVHSKVPAHVSRPVVCQLKHGGRAAFNDLSPADPNQHTIDEQTGVDG